MGTTKVSTRQLMAAAVFVCVSISALALPPPDETPPSTPPSFTATAVSGTQINLAWGIATDNKAVTGYMLYLCPTPSTCSVINTMGTTPRSFSHANLTPGATYSYRLTAFDAAGNQSETAASASATTFDTVAPTNPTNLAAVAASGSAINLTWTASTDAAGISGYSIERCAGAGCSNFSLLSSTSSTSYSAVGLTSAASYSFRVRAYDPSSNYSGYSNVASATTLDVIAPTGPATVTATAAANGTQVDLSWPAASDNVGVTNYQVERCTGAGCGAFVLIATTTSTSYSATGLTYSTPYSFQVRANDAVPNYGAYSATASATTANAPPPSAVTSLSASAASTTQINLSWPAASSSIGISGYQVDRCQGASCSNFTLLASTGSTSYSATGLSPGTSYSFRVRAYDIYPNYGGYSPSASATTQGSSAPPNETITYTYDALGRLTGVSRAGTVNNGEQAQYQYDANGNRTNVNVIAAP